MSEHERRLLDDDLPAPVPKPAPKAMTGRAPDSERALERLRERVLAARSPRARAAVLGAIERRYGAATARRLAAEVPTPPGHGGRGRGADR